MAEDTKACSLTEDEVKAVLQYHARQIAQSGNDYEDYIDRMNYLNKRLKAFKEIPEIQPAAPISNSEAAAKVSW